MAVNRPSKVGAVCYLSIDRESLNLLSNYVYQVFFTPYVPVFLSSNMTWIPGETDERHGRRDPETEVGDSEAGEPNPGAGGCREGVPGAAALAAAPHAAPQPRRRGWHGARRGLNKQTNKQTHLHTHTTFITFYQF